MDSDPFRDWMPSPSSHFPHHIYLLPHLQEEGVIDTSAREKINRAEMVQRGHLDGVVLRERPQANLQPPHPSTCLRSPTIHKNDCPRLLPVLESSPLELWHAQHGVADSGTIHSGVVVASGC